MSAPELAFDPLQLKSEIEELIVDEGPLMGQRFTVLPWQMKLLEAVASHKEVALSLARSNGKSTVVAALCCSAITPGKSLFVPRGQIILTAASMQQARVAFQHIQMFMRPVMYDELDGELKLRRGQWRELDNSHHMEITHKPSGTRLKVIGSDPKRAHGLAPTIVIADEPAQWESGGDMHYAALRTSLGKQVNARMLLIGTRPRNPIHFFNKLLYNPPAGTKSIVYAADKKDGEDGGLYKLKTIRKANPSYDHLEPLRLEIQEFAEGARKLGGMRRAQYMALYLNMGTTESDAQEEVIDDEAWETVTKVEQPERRGKLAIGVDLGGGNSLTAIAFYWYETGRLECYAAVPEHPPLDERGMKDGIGSAYEEMFDDGVLHIYGKKETRNSDFLRDFFEEVKDFEWIGVACDRYKKTAVEQALIDAGYSESLIIDRAVGRGSDGWGDLESFRGAVLEEHLKPGLNLALEHAIHSAVVTRDRNGNSSLDKTWQRGRIDVLQATIHAVGVGERVRRPPGGENKLSEFMQQMVDQNVPLVVGV